MQLTLSTITLIFCELACITFACNDELKNAAIDGIKNFLEGAKIKKMVNDCCVQAVKTPELSNKEEYIRRYHRCFEETLKLEENSHVFKKMDAANFTIEGGDPTCFINLYKTPIIKVEECKSFRDEVKVCLTNMCLEYKEINKDDECTMKLINMTCDILSKELQ